MKGDTPMKLIENNIQKIIDLCKKHKVHKLFVFGSVLTSRFNDNSDVDLVVDFKVDLLEEQTIKNPYLKKNVDATKTLIYG